MHNKLPNIISNDGRFHNGNPATGSLGTIVDDVWLNNVQDSLQDFFDELNNVLALVSVQANPAKKTQVAEAITTLIGNVRRVADSNTRSLQNVIYNSKKSNAIDSPSSDTVATSFAVKTAYDLAASKQSPATTLEGYGITDAVMVKGHQSVNLDQLLNQSAVWRVTGANKDVVGFTDKNIYNFGVGLTLASGPCAGMLYMPHATVKPKLYLKSSYASYTPSPWEEVAMVDDVVKKTGDTMTGRLSLSHFAYGRYDQQKDNEAPFFVREHNANGLNLYYPALKTRIRNGDGWVSNFSFGYTAPNGRNQWGEGTILLNEDNGNHRYWRFNHNGDFVSSADVVADNGYRLKNTHQVGNAYVDTTIRDASYGGVNIRRRGTEGNWDSRIEPLVDRRWKFWVQNSHEIFLPAKGGTVLLEGDLSEKTRALVSRRDYSRTVRGTNANWDNGTSKSIAVTGSVEIYPDGKIVQYFYYRNFRVHWFDYEIAPSEHFRVPEIPIQLWTAMPNKITYVSGHISRTNDTSIWPVRSVGAEASEWTTPLWAFEKQGNLKDRCSVYTRRLAGDTNETVDMLIRVEGY